MESWAIFCSYAFFLIALQASSQDFGFYIGLRDVTGNNMDYKWERDGDDLTFANWGTGQPSGGIQRCADVIAFPMFGAEVGEWDDIGCHLLLGALCEADPVSKVSS